jgi:hypothetical protein
MIPAADRVAAGVRKGCVMAVTDRCGTDGYGADSSVKASGNGVAHFEGQGTVTGSIRKGNLTVSGACTVTVDDCEGMETVRSGAIRYRGISGAFSVGGADFVLTMDGMLLTFSAATCGSWQFRGKGSYITGSGGSGCWDRLTPAFSSIRTTIHAGMRQPAVAAHMS